MKRRLQTNGDSFDLFLDTICNTFGGIVFLAILVALLAKVRHDPSGTDAAEKPVTAVMMQTLQLEMQKQQRRLSDLQTLRDQMPHVPVDQQIVALADLSDEIESLNAAEDRLLTEREEAGKRLAAVANEAAAIPEKIEQAEEQLGQVSEQLATARAKWQVVRKQKATTIQIPREVSGEGSSGIVLLSRNELFLVCSPDYGVGEFFDTHVTATPISDSNGYTILPRYGRGLPLGGERSITAIRGTAERLSRKGNTLIIAVYPDSYHQFGPVRDAFKAYGMSYELWIQGEDEPLKVFYGDGRGRVQ